MAVEIDLTWIAFWLCVGTVLVALIFAPHYKQPQEIAGEKCAENGGVPLKDAWGNMTDCKLYK